MKKFLLIILIIISITLITGCTTKETLDQNQFKNIMTAKQFKITDMTSIAIQSNKGVEYCYYATTQDNRYKIEYYAFNSEMSAQAFYAQKHVELTSTGAQASTELNNGNFSKYVQNFKGKYSAISRISNTVVFVNVDSNYSQEVKELLKDIGY